MNILIADDYQIVRRGIRQILHEEYESAHIDEAADAQSAIDKIIHNTFDIVICDLSMPGRSGLEVIQHIKEHSPALPILIMSIHPDVQYAVRVLKAGASGYLNKDAAAQELIRAIKTILSGKQYVAPEIAEKMAVGPDGKNEKRPHELLSNREFDVFKMLAAGKTVTQVAELLSLAVPSVNTYRRRILTKMNKKNNSELTRYALDNNLI